MALETMDTSAEKGFGDGIREKPLTTDVDSDTRTVGDNVEILETAGSDNLHRKLTGTQVQLFAIGGAIGTSLFVQMGSVLPKSGPAGLFIGFALWSTVIWAVNECFAEMVCYLPVQSPFIRLAGHWVVSTETSLPGRIETDRNDRTMHCLSPWDGTSS